MDIFIALLPIISLFAVIIIFINGGRIFRLAKGIFISLHNLLIPSQDDETERRNRVGGWGPAAEVYNKSVTESLEIVSGGGASGSD